MGDSRAVAGVQQEGGGWRAEALSVDHSINDPAERARVLAAGGQTAAKAGTHSKLSEMICVPKAEGSLKVRVRGRVRVKVRVRVRVRVRARVTVRVRVRVREPTASAR